jgi:hypothetical protein
VERAHLQRERTPQTQPSDPEPAITTINCDL